MHMYINLLLMIRSQGKHMNTVKKKTRSERRVVS